MAYIRKLPGSRNWVASLTNPDGSRTCRSTKTPDRKLAQRIADEWQDVARRARSGRLSQNQVFDVVNDLLRKIEEETLPTKTLKSFLDEWLDGKKNPRTAIRYRHAVDLFTERLGKRANASLREVSHEDIIRFIKHRQAQGVAPRTILVDVKALGTAFNLARKLRLIQSSPVEQALALNPLEGESSKRDCFSLEQVMALLAAAPRDWQTGILLGYYTSARLGDCANMRWANVRWANARLDMNLIDYVPQKTRRKNKRVVVPMSSDLQQHLESIASTDEPQEFLCPSLANRSSGGKTGLSEEFRRLILEAGIDPQTGAGQGKRQFSKLTFHSLRHSFNTELARRGVRQEVRMKLTGHSTVAINDDYTKFDLPQLRSAIGLLPSVLKR